MKSRIILILPFLAVGLSAISFGAPSDAQAVKEFLNELPADPEWQEWLKENGPIYGNYCALEEAGENYDSPCLSRLDCVCKGRQFGLSLQRFMQSDIPYLERILGFSLQKQTEVSYDILFRVMTSKMFAARLIGVDISEGIKSAYLLYESQPQKALANLDLIIDESEVYRKKIEEINIERLKYEDRKREGEHPDLSWSRDMAVSMHPFHFIFGLFYLNYEYKFASHFSFRIGTSVYASGLIADTYLGFENGDKNFSTFLTLGLKSFVYGESLSTGMYIEPVVEFGYENVARVAEPTVRDRDIAFVPAALFGFEKVFFSGIQLDFALGGGVHIGIPISETDFTSVFFVPKLRVSVGFAW